VLASASSSGTPGSVATDGVSGRNMLLAQESADRPVREREGAIWRLPKGVSLLWRSWDEDEVIVFNRASGQTHLLDAFSAAVLRRIEAAPGTISDLQRQFAIGFELDEHILSERLDVVCRRFDQLGLAEPEAP
jgi:PqqD family protein of HPr-rel-A system